MGAWQLLWLTVNRILVRHTASGGAHGAWHWRRAVLSCNTPTVPSTLCVVPLLQPAQTLLVSNLWSKAGGGGGWVGCSAVRKRYVHILTPKTWHVPHVFPRNYKEPFCIYNEKETPKSSWGIQGARITLWTAVNQADLMATPVTRLNQNKN